MTRPRLTASALAVAARLIASTAVARAATLQAARDLSGSGSAAETAVGQAWTAVGVL
jgi:Zn-dependent metalloprotease